MPETILNTLVAANKHFDNPEHYSNYKVIYCMIKTTRDTFATA